MGFGVLLEVIEARHGAPAEIRLLGTAGPGVPALLPMENPALLFFSFLSFIFSFFFSFYFLPRKR